MSYYFTNDETLKSEIRTNKVIIGNLPFTFYTDNGVFSKKGLDFGTRTLLESLENISGDVLDLGCGYGPIGIYIASKYNVVPDMVDVNKRSMDLSVKNAKLNKVDINVFESDGYSNVTKKYDYIITNPPIRVGKTKLYSLLFDATNYLKENGEMWLVVHKDQGAKTLAKDLEKSYEVVIKNKNKGFYIIMAKKKLNWLTYW